MLLFNWSNSFESSLREDGKNSTERLAGVESSNSSFECFELWFGGCL